MDKKQSLRLAIDLNKAELVWISQLVALRKAKGLVQGDVAERMGVDQSTVSRLENLNSGNRSANIGLLSKYARAIGAYTGHIVVDAASGDGYQLLKKEIEKHTHSLIHDDARGDDSATSYFVTDALPHNGVIQKPMSFVFEWPQADGPQRSSGQQTIYFDDTQNLEGSRHYDHA